MWHSLYHALAWTWGGDHQGGPSGTGYLIASGIVSALGSLSIFGAAIALVQRTRCSEQGCWRWGRKMDSTGNRVCLAHYSLGLPKPAWDAIPEVRAAYERWREKKLPPTT